MLQGICPCLGSTLDLPIAQGENPVQGFLVPREESESTFLGGHGSGLRMKGGEGKGERKGRREGERKEGKEWARSASCVCV